MNNRPRIIIEKDMLMCLCDVIAIIGVVAAWVLSLVYYSYLPNTIPIHLNAAGEANGFGNRLTIFLIPLIATVIISGIYGLSKYPHLFNYARPITNDNAEQMYRQGIKLLCVVNAITSVILFLVVASTINAALDGNSQISKWILPIIMTLSSILVIYSIIGAIKTASNK